VLSRRALLQAASAVRLLLKKGGESKGCAYLDFASDAQVEDALQKNDMVLHNRHLYVARSDPERAKAAAKGGPQVKPRQGDGAGGRRGGRGGRGRHGAIGGRSGARQAAGPSSEHPHERLGAAVMVPRAAATNQAASNSDFKAMFKL
jgi:hypothetical protein